MAGSALDRLLFPRRDGPALSHLCRQLEDSAERIHRACAIRRRFCFSCSRNSNRGDLGRIAGTQPKTFIMVNLIEMPNLTPTAASLGDLATATTVPLAPVIDVRDFGFAYGHHQILHEIN